MSAEEASAARTCPQCDQPVDVTADGCYACGAALTKSYSGVVPYRNVPALVAYYLAIFSLLPIVGIPLGATAVVLGVVGLRKRMRDPAVKGSVHAWIGIVGGGGLALLWGASMLSSIAAYARP